MKLTDEMRQHLRSADNALLPYFDMVFGFMREFSLTPDQAGELLAQWVRESI
jgi:hypothetical protein